MSGSWASGWRTLDALTTGEFAKGAGLIANETKASAGASFDFSNLPTTYAHLRVIIFIRGTTAATNTSLHLRFNNDSGANYDQMHGTLTGTAGTWASSEGIAGTNAQIGTMPASTAPANSFAGVILDIPHYANAADHKTYTGYSAVKFGTATGNFRTIVMSGWWRSTAAINRIQILPGAGSFDVGSRCSIYAFGD